jgi:hypothetical protein
LASLMSANLVCISWVLVKVDGKFCWLLFWKNLSLAALFGVRATTAFFTEYAYSTDLAASYLLSTKVGLDVRLSNGAARISAAFRGLRATGVF